MSGHREGAAAEAIPRMRHVGTVAGPRFQVGQRVFGRHGATDQYFSGYVLAVDPDQVFPYLIEVGSDETLHVLSSELQSDLPAQAASADDLLQWLLADTDR